jgi:hypothetical protein
MPQKKHRKYMDIRIEKKFIINQNKRRKSKTNKDPGTASSVISLLNGSAVELVVGALGM